MEPGHTDTVSPNSSASNNKTSNDFTALRTCLTVALHSSKETHLRIKDVNLPIVLSKAFHWFMPKSVIL